MGAPHDSPKISVITPSLNHAEFLRDTIESILQQSFNSCEHIVVDGGSTDGTVEILEGYPHIRWVSEEDDREQRILGVYRRAFDMSQGEYIIQCCVSDGFLQRDWFQTCARILDEQPDVSLVWGLPQYMSEAGNLMGISYARFLDEPPPQKDGFLPYWLATGFILPEGNYCVRRAVFDACFPKWGRDTDFLLHPALGFCYHFHALGYLPYFVPVIANYSKVHRARRGVRLRAIENPIMLEYYRRVRQYRSLVLGGKVHHRFRDGGSGVLREMSKSELASCRRAVWRYRISESRLVRTDLHTLQWKVRKRLASALGRTP